MFHSKKIEHRISSIHKRVLKLIYQDSHDLTFQELLAKTNQLVFTEKNLQLLATEIFKFKIGLSPELMNDIFHFVERRFCKKRLYIKKKTRSYVYHGSESLSSRAPKLWDILPNSIKKSTFLKEFKTKINT